jgi:class 3 adenylate cyclase
VAVASIVCVDDDLDVHDTASAAVAAAIERRRETPTARIGVCVGDIEVGDPLGLAKRLCAIAEPGVILVSDAIRRAVEPEHRSFLDLGAVAITGYADRIHVFELEGARQRDRCILAIDLEVFARVVGKDVEDSARDEAELADFDRTVWRQMLAHRGFVQRVERLEYTVAFANPSAAVDAALALYRVWSTHEAIGRLVMGLEQGRLTYIVERWWGPALTTARRVASSRFQCLGMSMAVVESLGHAEVTRRGLLIEEVHEMVQKGVRDPVRVAHVRIT